MSESTQNESTDKQAADFSDNVARHYNSRKQLDVVTRQTSRIYYLRNFNNWIKSTLINEFVKKIRGENTSKNQSTLSVHDLGCGKGGDILKWCKNSVSSFLFTDIAEVSLMECKNRFHERSSFLPAKFIKLDATKESIKEKLNEQGASESECQYDLVSSQFVIHYSFESCKQADMFLRNVSDTLKPGGYFIGTTTNAHEIVKRWRASTENSFGNHLFSIRFGDDADRNRIGLFGVKFYFQLDDVVECPEFLLNFEVLVSLARKHGLQLVFKKTFSEMFYEYVTMREHAFLIPIIKALKPYYPKRDDDDGVTESSEFVHIENKLKDDEFKNALQSNEYYATLSKSEWEAITLYLAFGFKKIE